MASRNVEIGAKVAQVESLSGRFGKPENWASPLSGNTPEHGPQLSAAEAALSKTKVSSC